MKLAGFRLVGGFRGKLRAARSEACSLRFERIRRSRERKKGRSRRFLLERVPRFRRRKSWRFGEGDVSRPRSFRCYIATSRCPTAFLLFTRFLVARSSRAIPSSCFPSCLPLLPGLSTATFARVRCEECDTPRFTTRTREMRKRGGGVRPRGRPRRRGILEKGDVQRLEDREREWREITG